MSSIKAVTTKTGERRWRARWRNPNGESKERWFATRREAEAHVATVEVAKLRGEYVDPQRARTTVSEYMVDWRGGRTHLAPKTLATEDSLIRNHIEPTFGRRALGSIQRPDLTKWISGLVAKGYSPATIHKIVVTFSALLESAADDGFIPRSPAHKLDLPTVRHEEKRFLSHQEIASLADAIDPRYKAMVLTGAYAGLRLGEMAGLRVARLDLLRKTLRVEETVGEVEGRIITGPTKTRSSRRTVSLPGLLVEALEAHLTEYGTGEDGLVFASPNGGPLRASGFRSRIFKPAVERSVGLPCTPHDLRHSHVALLIADGTHPKTIQARMGHSSIRVTLDTYGHLFDGLDEAAADALDVSARGVAVGLEPGHDGEVVALGL